MGVVLPYGTRVLADGQALYRCATCGEEFTAPAIRFADGVWAAVAAVYCSGGCMGKAAGLPDLPAGTG